MRHAHAVWPAVLLLAGCATSGPVSPTTTPQSAEEFATTIVTTGDFATSALGALNIEIDPVTLDYTTDFIAPRQGAGQGDNFHLSIRPFLAPKHLKLVGIERTPDDTLAVTMRLTHPFAAPADLVGPPTATKRVDLHVFDVTGILVADGTDSFYTGSVLTNGDLLVNADGYRDPGILFDKAAFGISPGGANVFPYRVFANAYDPVSDRANQGNYNPIANGWQDAALLAPQGFDVFAQGTSADVVYEIKPPGSGAFNVALVVTAKYQDPRSAGAGKTKRLPTGNPADLRYILPEGCGDLQRIAATVTGTLRDDRDTDIATIDMHILDWDQDATVNLTWPNGSDLSEIREDSAIGGVELDVPSLQTLPTTGSAVTGVPGNAMLWASGTSLNNALLFDAGTGGEEVLGLIRVLDNQDLDDGSPSGIKPYILNEQSTAPVTGATLPSTRYQIVRIPVEDQNGGGPNNDEAPAATTFSFPASVIVNTQLDLDLDSAVPGLATLDPDGLSLFEVDWDNDGTYDQNIMATSGSPAADFLHTYTVVNPTQMFRIRITDNYPVVPERLSTVYGPFSVNVMASGGPLTPVFSPPGPVNNGQLGSSVSFQYDRFIRAIAADASGNVYVCYRYGGTIPYSVVRSADGGTTFGTPVDVTSLVSSKGMSIAVLANGNPVVCGMQGTGSTTPGALHWMRLTPSGVNGLTAGTLETVSAAANWLDPTIATDKVDPTKAWITVNNAGAADHAVTVYGVTNATATPTFTQLATLDPAGQTGSIGDPNCVLGTGGILHVIWTNAEATSMPGVYYRGFNTATNMATGAEERVSDVAHTATTQHGFIEVDLSGVPMVAYDTQAGSTVMNDIIVTKRNGGIWSTPTAITSGADVGQQAPYVARDATGRFVVVWRDNRASSTDANVYGRILNADLTPATAEFAVDNTTQDTQHPKIVWTGTANNFALAWADQTGALTTERVIRRTMTY